MIELTEEQRQAVNESPNAPVPLLDPQTQQTFVLLRLDVYQRLKDEEYDDSPWTSAERLALAWEAGKHAGWEDMDEYDSYPDKP
jgi:hypothetical protein